MDTSPWDEIVNASRVSSIDSVETLMPYNVENCCIVSIYDPMRLCNVSQQNLIRFKLCGFLEMDLWNQYPEGVNILDNSWLGTKILRYLITANLYVYTSKSFLTNALGVIPREIEKVNRVLETCKRLNLCCCIYSPIPMDGFDKINLNNEDPIEFNKTFSKPHHLQTYEIPEIKTSRMPVFKDWYCKIYRYYITECQLKQESIMWTKRFLQWSWMKFLTPIAANENVINVNELVKSLIRNMKKITHVEIGLKFILNAAKCHPIQLSGLTTLIAYNKTLSGNEIPFRNFRYIFSQSMIQWIHGSGDIMLELLTAWSYQNDWIVNKNQKNVLETLMYCEYEDLVKFDFPRNLNKIWNKNKMKIQARKICNYAQKTVYVAKVIRLLYEVG